MPAAAQAAVDAHADIDWLALVDCAVVRAHQHAAGTKGAAGNRSVESRPRANPRRIDHQDSRGLRQRRPGPGLRGLRRRRQRLGPLRAGHELHPRPATRAGQPRTRPHHVIANKGAPSADTCATAASPTPSRKARTSTTTTQPRPTRLPTTDFQQADPPPPQRRGTLLQPARAMPLGGHTPRQDLQHLVPGDRDHRRAAELRGRLGRVESRVARHHRRRAMTRVPGNLPQAKTCCTPPLGHRTRSRPPGVARQSGGGSPGEFYPMRHTGG
ncbi:hypothetical protein SAMN05421541_10599 [Actinoplanes philippinensis]|uniref:Uncharacterized protein n=1 Tax=Actinoplanes philippinensis TaxID=35752 RepID=A0A1I2F501_9ACTN|nr:hypothetical protein SAMN05421541_10599 [Actinoplanes philippinensis]